MNLPEEPRKVEWVKWVAKVTWPNGPPDRITVWAENERAARLAVRDALAAGNHPMGWHIREIWEIVPELVEEEESPPVGGDSVSADDFLNTVRTLDAELYALQLKKPT